MIKYYILKYSGKTNSNWAAGCSELLHNSYFFFGLVFCLFVLEKQNVIEDTNIILVSNVKENGKINALRIIWMITQNHSFSVSGQIQWNI